MSLTNTLQSMHGVASVASLKARGFGPGLLRRAVSSGLVERVRKGWLALPDAPPDLVRAVSLRGRLGCVSAAEYRGLWVHLRSDNVHIAVPRHSGRATAHATAGVIAHWQSENWSADRSALESLPDMALQIATCLPSEQAIATLDSALNRELLTMAQLIEGFESSRLDLSPLLRLLDPASQSGLESLCRVRLARLGLPVRSQVLIQDVGRVDLLVGDRLIIETDGREWHSSTEAFDNDRDRDLRLGLLGYRALRLTYAQVVRDWPLVELSIRAMVARGEHLWPR